MYFSSAKEMEKLDGLAVAGGLEIRQMMELAGWHLVGFFELLAIRKDARIAVVAGRGNKGGDGLSAARHLINHGYTSLSVVLESEHLSSDSMHHRALLERMNVPITVYETEQESAAAAISNADVIVDALIGYHLLGAPRLLFAELIERINARRAFVVAYDLPSGVDPDTGASEGNAIEASATLTLALPKKLFRTDAGARRSGKVVVADIGIPAHLYDRIAPGSRPPFGASGLLPLGPR